jgi:Cu/Zn superoxide dismutase
MTTTYYLLRTKESAPGNGAYLFHNSHGELALTISQQNAQHFDSLEAAEQYAIQIHESSDNLALHTTNQDSRGFNSIEFAEQYAAEVNEKFGIFEVEVRNSID